MIDSNLRNAFRFHMQRFAGFMSAPAALSLVTLPVRGNAARHALAKARADVAEGKARYPLAPRSSALGEPFKADGYRFGSANRASAGLRWAERPADVGLRVVGWADEVQTRNGAYLYGIDHQGWFTDSDGGSGRVLRGVVLQLPARNGVPRYVAGYAETESRFSRAKGEAPESVAVALGELWEGERGGNDQGASYDQAAREAASRADGIAENVAEDERAYNEAWQAGQKWAELGEQVKAERREALAILAERRAVKATQAPTLCAVIRQRVESLVESIQSARDKRAELESGSYFGAERGAFNEGAGCAVIAE